MNFYPSCCTLRERGKGKRPCLIALSARLMSRAHRTTLQAHLPIKRRVRPCFRPETLSSRRLAYRFRAYAHTWSSSAPINKYIMGKKHSPGLSLLSVPHTAREKIKSERAPERNNQRFLTIRQIRTAIMGGEEERTITKRSRSRGSAHRRHDFAVVLIRGGSPTAKLAK